MKKFLKNPLPNCYKANDLSLRESRKVAINLNLAPNYGGFSHIVMSESQ